MIKHFCSECGNEVYDSCGAHPGAVIDSAETEGDKTDALIQQQISRTAEAYRSEFDTLKLDGEWSETAYADLPGEAQERITWSEFHNSVQGALEA